jgi:hypothetical protein
MNSPTGQPPVPGGPADNPFRIHGIVTQSYFTNRAAELRRILTVLAEPGAKLVIYGPRRMGKTSAVAQALLRHRRKGGTALLADLSTASSAVDMSNRVLEAAVAAFGRKWRDAVTLFVERIGVSLTLKPDPATGLIIPAFDVSLRAAPPEEQHKSLAATLNAIEALAVSKKTTIAVVLDEFQEITRFGGETAEWALRGAMQRHSHLSYVLAGSASHLIQQMLGKGRALYALLDQMEFGPIDADHLSAWIDSRLGAARIRSDGAGARAVELAGPRTRDIVQLARQTYANTIASRKASAADVDVALDHVVAEQDAPLRAMWSSLTSHQQNVLRAVAFNRQGLTTGQSLTLFALPSSGTATNAAAAMVESGLLERGETASGYGFDSPYFRRWVERNTLADVGLIPRT